MPAGKKEPDLVARTFLSQPAFRPDPLESLPHMASRLSLQYASIFRRRFYMVYDKDLGRACARLQPEFQMLLNPCHHR